MRGRTGEQRPTASSQDDADDDPTAAAVSAFAIGVVLVLVLGIARLMGLEEFAGF